MGNNSKQKIIEDLIMSRWPSAGRKERKLLVDIMCASYSPKWFDMLDKAKAKQIEDYDLILARADIIENNAYEGLSRSDGTIVVPDSVQELRPQLDALLEYIGFRNHKENKH